MTDHPTWQITLHDTEDSAPFAGTFFAGSAEDAASFALTLREPDRPVWIRIEHIPCLTIIL